MDPTDPTAQASIDRLLEDLAGDDPDAREDAARALLREEAAGPALLRELSACEDPDRAELLCRLLRRHVPRLDAQQCGAIIALADRAVAEELAADEYLLNLAAAVAREGHAAELRQRARWHREAGRSRAAFALLSRLDDDGLLDEESRFDALIAGLSSFSEEAWPELERTTPASEPVVRQVVELVRTEFPLAARLTAERAVPAEGIFHLGSGLLDSPDAPLQELGRALLAHLTFRAPRSRLARSARRKLSSRGPE
jgi:hypothetical protein